MPTGAGWTRAYSRAGLRGVSVVGAGAFPGEGAGRTMGAGRAGRGRQTQDAPPTCGQLLQRYRMLAGLTQEELAGRAGKAARRRRLPRPSPRLPAPPATRLNHLPGSPGPAQA